jgi:uncharacterized protein (DUF362 family)
MILKTSRKSGGRLIDSKSLREEYEAKELSRRQMLQSAMVASVGAWLGTAGLAGCTNTVTTVKQAPEEAPPEETPGQTPGTPGAKTPHLVGMGYHESDRGAALRAALEETVGLGMIKAGQSVCIRVNSNSGDVYPYSTSPDTLLAIGGMLRDLGVTDIRIGDRSFWGDQNTAGNLEANGIAQAARTLGTKAVVYDDSVDWMTLGAASVPNWKGTVRLPTTVTTADHVLILSCVKTHFISTVTMSLKIALGLVHPTDRQRDGNLKTHDARILHKQIAQINSAFTASLVIQDGYSAVISGGPTMRDKPQGAPAGWSGGITGDPKVFIVSADRIAADVAGIAVLQTLSPAYEQVQKSTAFANPTIQAAIAAGNLGITSPAAFDLSGPTVPSLETFLAKARAA